MSSRAADVKQTTNFLLSEINQILLFILNFKYFTIVRNTRFRSGLLSIYKILFRRLLSQQIKLLIN